MLIGAGAAPYIKYHYPNMLG